MFETVLIANRGEIALRIISTCKRMGIRTIAIHSDVDFRAPFVREADEKFLLGPAPAPQSYLVKERVIEAALKHGAQAIHPGYGFLSENPEFAAMVVDAGLTFIGPSPSAISLLGDKIASKELAVRVGMPVVAGNSRAVADADEALSVAESIGYPVLLKPAAGGGGRGMRVVTCGEELPRALQACRDETRKAFGDDRVFIEQYVQRPRHIEFQIMADRFGNVVHLGERECSIQRRHQKIIEETPSVALNAALRNEMGALACKLAQAAQYANAGTVEFILDENRNFFFLEMNTRLQVEHPVTEMVTGQDLVEWQLRIASGEPLPLTQHDIRINGWAIEARICAEDPSRGFFPTTGQITRYAVPRGRGIRVDGGVDAGSAVTVHYDSLLAKVIAWGQDREGARKNLVRALNGYHIEGPATNVDFCNAVVDHPIFAGGTFSTGFIEEHFPDGSSDHPADTEKIHYMLIAAVLIFHCRRNLVRDSLKIQAPHVGGQPLRPGSQAYVVKVDESVFNVQVEEDRVYGDPERTYWSMQVDGRPYSIVAPRFEFYRRRLKLIINGSPHMFRARYLEHHVQSFYSGIVRTVEVYTPKEWAVAHHMIRSEAVKADNVLRCPMPGKITAVCVEPGRTVRKGQELFRIESMKMESSIAAPFDAVVEELFVNEADKAVDADDVLLTFRPE